MPLHIREITPADAAQWEAMRCELWPDGVLDHGPEIALFFEGALSDVQEVLVAESEGATFAAFAELSIRYDVAGIEGKRACYVEGLYVPPRLRHRGIARQLLQASRTWARANGCEAFASDRAGRVVVDRTFPDQP